MTAFSRTTRKTPFLSVADFVGFLVLLGLIVVVCGLEQCNEERGGGVCPDGNTCCLRSDGLSGCIPSDLGSRNATCCQDDGRTGCAVGYICSSQRKTGRSNKKFCVAGPTITDPLVQVLPRYPLCHASEWIKQVHGLPVTGVAKLAYYSTVGDLTKIFSASSIKMALVVVHGAGRNADDYFCTAVSAVERQKYFDTDSVLVIAPRFAVKTDSGLNHLQEGGVAIRWRDDGTGGPFRYGENAVWPDYVRELGFSSYDALDRIVMLLSNTNRFPSLRQVTMIGHSSGGQFVQRWSLTTPHWDNRIRSVVANPSSFAYLTPLRYVNEEWKIPPTAKTTCPGYNRWEWGLEGGGDYAVPYVQAVLRENSVRHLVQRFATRQVIYLAGGLDVCNVTGLTPGWCYSHGLETTCMDEFEGSNRKERRNRYVASLARVGVFPVLSWDVPGVGHDHSLMFHSENGLKATFADSNTSFISSQRRA